MIRKFFFSLLALVAVLVGWFSWFAMSPLQLAASPLDFSVSPGASLRAASQQMSGAGIGFRPWQFTLLARFAGKASEIKAGSYEVTAGITPWQLLQKLTRGDFSQGEVALIEGKTFWQFRAQLDANPDLRHDTANLSDAEILARLGATESHPEGLFFPDTYLFAKRSSDLEVLRRAYKAMQQHLATEWQNRSPDSLCGSPYEALILASIIEKESGRPGDREQISAVFANRLKKGMPLQTDPTIIYGLGEQFSGRLRKRDLTADGSYNTYTRKGLPPTPIATPGLASIRAALHPTRSDMLYFVARGDGSSEFSVDLEAHNRAVTKYQKGK